MNYYVLSKHTDKTKLYEGDFNSFIDCLEDAVSKNIPLSYIDLSNKNLTNANLDGCIMHHADFTGTNLSGANLSEANITNATFANASLYNTCLSYSNIQHSNFNGASFGATLIEGADLEGCTFSTLSCFDLDFIHTNKMSGCTYISPTKERCAMSNAPIIIKGLLNVPIIIFDDMMKIGNKSYGKCAIPQVAKIMNYYTGGIAT